MQQYHVFYESNKHILPYNIYKKHFIKAIFHNNHNIQSLT